MYQLTINNPEEKNITHDTIISTLREHFKTLEYVCMADEIAATPHTHIFVVFASRVRFSMVKKYFPSAHIERCLGTVSDNIDYLTKSGRWSGDCQKRETKIEGSFKEFGIRPPDSKGKRSDMSELYQMVLDNMTNSEILARNQDYILQLEKIDKLRTTILADRYKQTVRLDLEVIYISGPTGTGKTRLVLEENNYSNVFRVTDYAHPFDSYSAQPSICFEEFRSSLPIKQMLMYCDIYPIELPSRYTNKFACYTKIYIVSNWPLERQYEEVQKNDPETWEAFLRRIHKVLIFSSSGETTEYSSVEEYLLRDTFIEEESIPF